jgi:type IV secretory pathway TrbD component
VLRLSRSSRVTVSISAGLIAIGLIGTMLGADGGGWIAAGVGMFVWITACYIVCPLWRWRSEPLIRGSQIYIVGDDGIRCKNPVAESTVAWSVYRRAVEHPRFYLLFAGRRGGTPILKRGFASSDDEQRFRRVVGNHLPAKFGRPA